MPVIEIRHPIEPKHIRHALFDFDGTISLIREGWQSVMTAVMVETLRRTPTRETVAELTAVVSDLIERTTGQQTIYQMIALRAEVEKRGGTPTDPLAYKHEYLQRLNEHIRGRIAALKAGDIPPESLMVRGAAEFLRSLAERGVACYLASGTDEPFVRDEASALGVAHFFAGIYGAQDDYRNFSKRMVIEKIMAEHDLHGSQFVAFGDGVVEIEETKAVGGIAIGVASDERTRAGIDPQKRRRLISVGADAIIPDFSARTELLSLLGLSVR